MNRDKKVLYAVAWGFPCLLLLVLFVPNITVSKILLSVLSVGVAAVAVCLIKKRSILSLNKGQVTLLMLASALIGITLYYLSGLHFGFYKVTLEPSVLWRNVLPYAVIILTSELTRSVLVAQKNRTVTVLSYVALVLLEVMMTAGMNVFGTFGRFMTLVGMALFPAIVGNLLYHYLADRYGMWPNAVYRIFLTLYSYVIPIKPSVPDALLAFAKLVLPLLIYLFIHALYERRKFTVSYRQMRWRTFTGVLLFAAMAVIVMLISCRFRYGLIVVGSESMTGSVNMGDALVYERYEDQHLCEGEIILFDCNGTTVIHRIVEIRCINGENRYYTKGDANDSPDPGYVTESRIIGRAGFKIRFIGYPTIWVREIFS
ncbi:MAG: signal peptidase I [Clostridia bacterium]|nr:signal peptidase I [Clostridia bacterium]